MFGYKIAIILKNKLWYEHLLSSLKAVLILFLGTGNKSSRRDAASSVLLQNKSNSKLLMISRKFFNFIHVETNIIHHFIENSKEHEKHQSVWEKIKENIIRKKSSSA